jgi:hypothetical protein
VRIGLVEAELVLVGDGPDQGQVGRVRTGPGREGTQQRRHGARSPVKGEAEGVVGEHAGRLVPVAGRLQVSDGVGGLAARGEPARGELVQSGDVRGHRAAQFQPKQVGEHAVVSEPGTAGVEGYDERVGVLQVQQDPFRPRASGKQVGELAVDPVQHRGAQQQALGLRWLPLQHLGHQVLGDRAVAAGELGDEPFGVGVPGEG